MDPRDKHEVSLEEARDFRPCGPEGVAGGKGQPTQGTEAAG